MKNVFKKTVALVSAMSLVAAGSLMSVSASETAVEVEVLSQDSTGAFVSTAEVYEGTTSVDVQLKVKNSGSFVVDQISLRNIVSFDDANSDAGKVDPAFKSSVTKLPVLCQANQNGQKVQCMISAGSPFALSDNNEVLVTYTFALPEGAKVGDVFYINWAEDADYKYSMKNKADGLPADKPNYDSEKTAGKIVIVEDPANVVTTTEAVVTTTEAEVTTTEAEVTTTAASEVTTAAATTTTTAAATTTAATTTTTAAATTTVTKAANSPATGSSSNGVAALAVTMVAAAGAAIALKKKED